jgi:hypothetical protein
VIGCFKARALNVRSRAEVWLTGCFPDPEWNYADAGHRLGPTGTSLIAMYRERVLVERRKEA